MAMAIHEQKCKFIDRNIILCMPKPNNLYPCHQYSYLQINVWENHLHSDWHKNKKKRGSHWLCFTMNIIVILNNRINEFVVSCSVSICFWKNYLHNGQSNCSNNSVYYQSYVVIEGFHEWDVWLSLLFNDKIVLIKCSNATLFQFIKV